MFGFGVNKALRAAAERAMDEALVPARNMSPELFARGPRVRPGDRSIQNTGGATFPASDFGSWGTLFGPGQPNLSPEQAMAHSAFYRCVFLIAGSIAMLDFHTYKVSPDGHRERDETSPASRLIRVRPNGRMSSTMLWRHVVSDMLTNGNGIVWIARKPTGEPVALYPIPWRRTGIRLQNIFGETVQIYRIMLDDGVSFEAHQDDVLHIPGSAVWRIWQAMSPLTAYAMAANIALSADAFAKAYFDNGSSPDGYIKFPNALAKGKDQADEIRDYWRQRFSGLNRFAGPAVLTEGGEFVQMAINAADAQLLESRKFSVMDIARVFGVPPHMLGETDKATSFGKGLEEMTQSFLDFTLGPHLGAIEDEVNYKLVRQSTKIAEFDREGFVRGDLKSRMEAYQTALGGNNGPGMMTQNEVRKKLNLGPSEDPEAGKLVAWPMAASAPGDAGGDPLVQPVDDPGTIEEPPEEEPAAKIPGSTPGLNPGAGTKRVRVARKRKTQA